jgi:alkylhydroperoxidase family enzyme
VPTHVAFGRDAGLADDKMAHLRDDPLPDGVYDDLECTIITYARRSTRLEPIDDVLFEALATRFDDRQLIELCFTVGLSNMVNRFHATFHTDLDNSTLAELGESGRSIAARLRARPVERPAE